MTKAKGRDVPDAVGHHQHLDRGPVRGDREVRAREPLEERGDDAVAVEQPADRERANHRRDDEGQQRDEDHLPADGAGRVVDRERDGEPEPDDEREGDEREGQREAQRAPEVDPQDVAGAPFGDGRAHAVELEEVGVGAEAHPARARHHVPVLVHHGDGLDARGAGLAEEARRAGLDLLALDHGLGDAEGLDEYRGERDGDEDDHHRHRRPDEGREGPALHGLARRAGARGPGRASRRAHSISPASLADWV